MTREEIINSMSLQDAIQTLRDTNCFGTMDIAKSVILKALEQEPRTGHWLTLLDAVHQKEHYHCTRCRETFTYDVVPGITHYYKYCPECGAKMESEG